MAHAKKFLGAFDHILVRPRGSETNLPLMTSIHVPPEHMSRQWSYNKLLLTADFYKSFQDYEYILIYQLDCLVFSDQILTWCDQGWDYVGAPWFANYGTDPSMGFLGVGNGGLSLRKITSFLDVLDTPGIKTAVDDFCTAEQMHEDVFWSWWARAFKPDFNIPSPEDALPFAFECNPRACYLLNNNKLPFGCHAWPTYDREFWSPFTLSLGEAA